MYFESNKRKTKTMEELEAQQEKLARIHNNVYHAIATMENSKTYLSTRNLLNVFSNEEGVNVVEVHRLRKMLDSKVTELLETNDKKMQNIQKDIENIKSIKIEENIEQLQKLEYESNNVLYNFMSQLHTNGIQENSDRRRLGNWCVSPTRVEAVALQKLCALPQYSGLFTEKQRKVIVENAKNPDVVKHEQAIKPLLEQKQSELGKLYNEGFRLRHIKKQMSNDLKDIIKEG